MPPRACLTRTLWSAAAVIFAAVASTAALRGTVKPYAPPAPEYRQKGPPDAAVTVVEFSDFQCPACRFAVEPIKRLETLYAKDLRFIFKHYPLLRSHPQAKPAAMAAECAGRQGRFWEYHDRLYDNQADWNKATDAARFEAYAKDLKLDLPAFQACLKDPAVEAIIMRDMKDGDDRWVVSTPTIFINGKRFAGARQLTERGVIWIDKILKK